MREIKHRKEKQRLRRLALAAQGLLPSQPFGRGLNGARQAIDHLGYVQIDSISVVERAHHHVLYSRVPGFRPAMTHQLLLQGDVFEYWSHAAALLPISDFRFSLPYKHAIKSGQTHWYKNPDRRLMQELLARVRVDGPLRSRDVESNAQKRTGWWDWKPTKRALEQLYMEGDLMVSDREGFQKTYDLTERVLPAGVDTRMPSIDAYADHLLQRQLDALGVVALKGLTYLRRDAALRQAVKKQVDEQLATGVLEQVRLPSGEVFLLLAAALESRMPRSSQRLQILSPFDNSVIQRDRLKALFGFDYQLECYVPAAKRQYGYLSLPLLYRDQFIGRMDCKAHRNTQHLEVKFLHWEAHVFDEDEVMAAWLKAVRSFRDFQGCLTVGLTRVAPAHLKQPIQQALCVL